MESGKPIRRAGDMRKRSTKKDLQNRANILKALGHPSRLLMVEELARGERCVCELRDLVGADISTISKHLAVLKRAGILESRKDGLQIFYRLLSPCVISFFECVESVVKARARSGMAQK